MSHKTKQLADWRVKKRMHLLPLKSKWQNYGLRSNSLDCGGAKNLKLSNYFTPEQKRFSVHCIWMHQTTKFYGGMVRPMQQHYKKILSFFAPFLSACRNRLCFPTFIAVNTVVATTALPSIWSQFQMIPTNYWINLHPMIFIIFSSFSPVGEENILTIPHYFKSWETGAEREKLVVALVMGRIPFVENYDSWPLVIHRLHFPCTTTPHYSPHFVSF